MIRAVWINLFVLAQLFALPAFATSYYCEATTTETGAKGKGTETVEMHAWVDGPRVKVEFVEGKKSLPDGSYLLTDNGGETIYFVNPKKRAYARWSLDEALEGVVALLNKEGGFIKLELSDVVNETLIDEPGDKILGHSTTHRRWKSAYTVKSAVMGMRREQRKETVRDVWLSNTITESGFEALLRPSEFDTGHEELDKALEAELGRPEGFALKSVSVSKIIDKKGNERMMRSATDVTELRDESIADAVFRFPSEYEELPLKKIR